jgi:glycerol uptake facilitator-like aquaporin
MASLMLIVPTLVPVAEVVEGWAAAADGAFGGVAALLVCAKAEIAHKAAIIRKERKNLLVIGSIELLGTRFFAL